MSFENFPYSNFHELNLDWIVQKLKEAYSSENPPDYPVKSVNGQTGDVIIAIPSNFVQSVNGETGDVVLYRNPLTQFPATDEVRWNLFRICDGTETGIEFDENGASRIEGIRRIKIYDEDNPPDYPVTSVNGQTGDVQVTAGVQSVNGKTGNVVTPFVNPNTDILTLDSNSPSILWGISRNVAGGNVALYITTGGTNPQAFIRYTPDGGQAINLPLLTNADIPESAGVVSVNEKTGAVKLYGSDIELTETDTGTISSYINNILYKLYGHPTYKLIADSYITTTGVITNYPGWSRTDYIDCENFTQLCVTYNTTTEHAPYNVFFDENKQYLKNFYLVPSERTAIVNIPENAKYAMLSNSTAIMKGMSIELRPNFNTLLEIDSKYTQQIAALQNADDTHNQQITALQNTDTTHTQQIAALQNDDTTHNQQIAALQNADTTHNQQITALQNADNSHAQQIAELQNADDTHNQQITALQEKDATQDQQIAELYTRTGVYVISISNVNTLPVRYPATGTDSKIKDTNKVVSMDLDYPGTQMSDWTITTYNGYLEITGTIGGQTNITLYLC